MEIKTACEADNMPERKHPFDAGADLRADLDGARRTVLPRTVAFINTGVRCEIPEGYVGFVFARSSMAGRGLMLANGVGVIDSGYTGEILVPLLNAGGVPSDVLRGERIAQLVIVPCMLPKFEQVESLGDTERGEGGFGSTGVE